MLSYTRTVVLDICGKRRRWKRWRWGEKESLGQWSSEVRTGPFVFAPFSWSSPWSLTRVGWMWWIHEFISDLWFIYLSFVVFSDNKGKWWNLLCYYETTTVVSSASIGLSCPTQEVGIMHENSTIEYRRPNKRTILIGVNPEEILVMYFPLPKC